MALAVSALLSVGTQTKDGRLTGTVTTGAGRAVVDARVAVHRPGEGTLAETKTDGGGRYLFDHLPAGTYVVEFGHPDFDIVRRHSIDIAAGQMTLDVGAHLTPRRLCECAPTRTESDRVVVAGLVTDDKSRPIPHARLDLRGARVERAYSGVDGEFAIRLPAGTTWTLVISDVYFMSTTRTLRVTRGMAPLHIVLTPYGDVVHEGFELLKRACICELQMFVHPPA